MFKIIKLDIMKKLLFTIALFCGMTAYAQQEGVRVPSGYQGFLEEGMVELAEGKHHIETGGHVLEIETYE